MGTRHWDFDNMGSPASTIDSAMMAENNCDAAAQKAVACIKAEVKLVGPDQEAKVIIKEGQNILDKLSPTSKDEFDHVVIQELSSGHCVDSKKVLEHIETTCQFLEREEPTVKDMRSGNPKAVQMLFHMKDVLKGSSKIKKTWAPENKPSVWPSDVPFEDPNNGKEKKAEKLRKEGLRKMHAFLRTQYSNQRDQILSQKQEYERNLPTLSRSSNQSPQYLIISQQYIRTAGMIKQTLGKTELANGLITLLDNIFTRSKEGEQMRLTLGEYCSEVQRVITLARLKEHMDKADLKKKLSEVYARYGSVEKSVQPVSLDTPTLYAQTNGTMVQGQDTQLLPSPYRWSIPTGHQQSLQQPTHQTEQQMQPMLSQQQPFQQDLGQQMSSPQELEQHFARLHFQMPPDNAIDVQTKKENYFHDQPNTMMDDMQTYGGLGLCNDSDYISNVMVTSAQPNQLLGKRKSSDDQEPLSCRSPTEKIYTSLQPTAPATELNTSSELNLIFEYINDKQHEIQLGFVAPEVQQEINNMVIVQDMTGQDTSHTAAGTNTTDWGQNSRMEVE